MLAGMRHVPKREPSKVTCLDLDSKRVPECEPSDF